MSESARIARLGWRWWSTQASVDRGELSVMALVETALAVSFYWFLSVYLETYAILISGILIGPMVLLRSQSSVSLGVQWFVFVVARIGSTNPITPRLEDRNSKFRPWLFHFAAGILLCGIMIAIDYSFFELSFQKIWSALLIFAIVFPPLSRIIGKYGSRLASTACDFAGFAAIRPISAILGTVSGSFLAFLIAFAILIISGTLLVFDGMPSIDNAVPLDNAVDWFLWLLVMITFGLVIGFCLLSLLLYGTFYAILFGGVIYLLSLLIRTFATLRHLGPGVAAFPQNFKRLILCTSPIHRPELIPGLTSQATGFTLSGVISRFHDARRSGSKGGRFTAWTIILPLLIIWFLPAWIYRVTLKSMAWFWWPLVFLGDDTSKAKHPDLFWEQTVFSLSGITKLAAAAITVAGFFVTSALQSKFEEGSYDWIGPFRLLFVLETDILPWQLLSLLIAVLALVIAFWLDSAGRQYRYAVNRHDETAKARAERQIACIERLARLRLILFVFFMGIAGAHALLQLGCRNGCGWIPDNVVSHIHWTYGEALASTVSGNPQGRISKSPDSPPSEPQAK